MDGARRVLDSRSGIQQFSSGDPDLPLENERHQFGQPIRMDDVRVIVQKYDDLTVCLRNGKIIEPRIVELTLVADKPDTRIAFGFVQNAQGLGRNCSVIDDQDFD